MSLFFCFVLGNVTVKTTDISDCGGSGRDPMLLLVACLAIWELYNHCLEKYLTSTDEQGPGLLQPDKDVDGADVQLLLDSSLSHTFS